MPLLCPACQSPNDDEARFCVVCGAGLGLTCPRCGSPIDPTQNFCGSCGYDLKRRAASPSPASYTPPHLARRILEERHLITGERKRVTVMFADIVGSTEAIQGADPEAAAGFLTTTLGAMMDAIHRYEGTVNELRGDGIMALFGAPIAHEDHAVRAGRAALEIPAAVHAVVGDAARTRVGLHSGEVLVREVGNDLSVEYQALGPTVHLAARMESLAEPGSTYLTNDVRRLAEGALETRSAGMHNVKGLAAPIEVFELTGVLHRSRWEARAARGLTTLVGRRDELDRLEAALGAVEDGQGRVVTIVGEAGVGKSRLLHEFLSSASTRSFHLLKAEASPFDTNSPYQPLIGALREWAGGSAGTPPTYEALTTHVTGVDDRLADAVPALAALIGVVEQPAESAKTDRWDALDPDERKRRTRRAIRALIASMAATGSLILVVEDLHWIDGETQSNLDDLVELAGGSPMLLVVTHRPEFVNQWIAKPHVDRIHLGELDDESATELVDALLGDDPSVAALKPLIVERGESTPFFLEEIVRALFDTDVLRVESDRVVAAAVDRPLEIPDGVQALLAARIDRLSPADKNTLQVAAVIGPGTEVSVLADLVDRTEPEIAMTLRRLANEDLLYETRVVPTSEYDFCHAITRDVAYESLPMADRESLHADVVTALESGASASDAGALPIDRLAFHAARGGLPEKAARYASLAATKAIDGSAFREAASLIRQHISALEQLPHDRPVIEQAIDARMRLRVAETGATGGLKRIQSDLAEAEALAESIDDLPRQAALAIHSGYTANMLGDVASAERHSRRALELGEQLGDRYLQIEARILLAQTYNYAGRVARVPDILRDDYAHLTSDVRHERFGQTMIRSVVATCHLSMSLAAMGEFDEACVFEDDAVAIADEAGRPFDQMYAQYAKGIRLDYMDDPEAAVAAHRESVAIAEANDLWFMTTFAQPWLGHALVRAGRPDEARELLERIEAAAARVELPFVEALSQTFGAQAAAALGDADSAEKLARQALSFDERYPNPVIECAALGALASVAATEDDRDRSLRRLISRAEEVGLRVWQRRAESGHDA